MVSEVADPTRAKVALNKLRKFDQAGRIMETEEGTAAVQRCTNFKRNDKTQCMLFADGHEKACAFCKRIGKGGCTASLEEPEPTPKTINDRLAEMQEQLDFANARWALVEEELRAAKSRIATLEANANSTDIRLQEASRILRGNSGN